MRRRERSSRRERGSTFVFIAVLLPLILGLAAYIIDMGFLFVTRTQLQNAADSAALAAAVGLAQSEGNQATATSYAVTLAGENQAYQVADEGLGNLLQDVLISEDDVTFLAANRVMVQTHRTVATGDPLRAHFLKIVQPSSNGWIDVTAAATASWDQVCGGSCMRPWAPPDRWYDADEDGTYNPDPSMNPDEYYDPDVTGYNIPDDLGVQVTMFLRKANQTMLHQWYYAVDYPPRNKGNPIEGGDQYREWIEGCPDPSVVVEIGDTLQFEPGNMKGPTQQGVDALIALDPGATWDTPTQSVVNSAYARSPRVVKACLFDPSIGVFKNKGRNCVVICKAFALFLESVSSQGDVTGRFLRMADSNGSVDCEEGQTGTFIYAVGLDE